MIKGNSMIKMAEKELLNNGVFVKAILHPTVPEHQERLRICFHKFNSKEEVDLLLNVLNKMN